MTAAPETLRRQPDDTPLLCVWREARRSLVAAACLALALASLLLLIVARMPALQPQELEVLRRFPPRSLPDLIAQRDVLLSYTASQPALVAGGYVGAYVLMQTFAVPGTLMLSVLAGALWGGRAALPFVAAVSTAGACSCYGLSWALGRQLVRAAWPERLDKYAAEVESRRHHLLNFVIFLRVTPFLPNTFINLASPIVGVPLLPFALGTLLGCAPNNFVAVQAGASLHSMQSLADLYDRRVLGVGALAGLAALSPVLLKWRHERLEWLQAEVVKKAR